MPRGGLAMGYVQESYLNSSERKAAMDVMLVYDSNPLPIHKSHCCYYCIQSGPQWWGEFPVKVETTKQLIHG